MTKIWVLSLFLQFIVIGIFLGMREDLRAVHLARLFIFFLVIFSLYALFLSTGADFLRPRPS